jgi:hypothetical protein
MQHYIFAMRAGDPDPVGRGDIKSWFEYYKMGNGPGTFVPFPAGSIAQEDLPSAGDTLWFAMDGFLIGVTKITGVLEGSLMSDKLEVYYDSDQIVPVIAAGPPEALVMGKVTPQQLAAWYDDYLQNMTVVHLPTGSVS